MQASFNSGNVKIFLKHLATLLSKDCLFKNELAVQDGSTSY